MFIGELVHVGPVSVVTWFWIQRLGCRGCSFTIRTMAWRAAGLIKLPTSVNISCAHGVLSAPYNENEPHKNKRNYTLTRVPHPKSPSQSESPCEPTAFLRCSHLKLQQVRWIVLDLA